MNKEKINESKIQTGPNVNLEARLEANRIMVKNQKFFFFFQKKTCQLTIFVGELITVIILCCLNCTRFLQIQDFNKTTAFV